MVTDMDVDLSGRPPPPRGRGGSAKGGVGGAWGSFVGNFRRRESGNVRPDNCSVTAPTAPLSDFFDFTPRSDSQSQLPPSYPGPMRSYVAVASTSLQSIRSMASIQSLTSLAGGRTSPNFIFEGGYNFSDHSEGVGDESEEDSYTQRVMSSH